MADLDKQPGDANSSGDPGAEGGVVIQRQADAAQQRSILDSGEGGEGGDGGEEQGKGVSWRDDWREAIVAKLPQQDREKELTRLKRFASPEGLYKSNRDLERRLSSGQMKATLAEDASPEELAAYRKAAGIPEKADGYGIAFPESLPVTDADKADLAAFTEAMHGANVPPGHVKVAFDAFVKAREGAMQRMHEAAKAAEVETRVALRTEYGRDFGRNMRLANDFAASHGGENAKELMGLTLADGTPLGNHPDFIRMLVNASLATADDTALITSEPGRGGKSVDDEINEIYALQSSDRNKYESQATQDRLAQLVTARDKKRSAA